MATLSERFPWQVSVLLTTLVYLAAAAGIRQLPCEMGLLVGLCELSRRVFLGIGVLVYLVFLGLAFAQRSQLRRLTDPERRRDAFNRRLFFQMLFFCLLVAAFYLAVLFDRP